MTPRKQEKIFTKQYAPELLKISKGDLESAKALAKAGTGRAENVCYLVHQCIEKALKAALVWKQISVPLVHDLGALIARVPSDANLPFGYELISINDYAAIRRYEEGSSAVTPEEIQALLKLGDTAIQWAQQILSQP